MIFHSGCKSRKNGYGNPTKEINVDKYTMTGSFMFVRLT